MKDRDRSLRVSDAEREQAVLVLREHLLAGRLTLDEFSERVGMALRAGIGDELARIQEDLPTAPAGVGPPRRKPARLTAAVLGHVARRGRLRLRSWTVAASVLGDLDFDLRESAPDRLRTAVTVLAAFGNVDVYVPEGVHVDVSGITVFGHRRDWGHESGHAGAPAIHVRAVGCFATVDVWRVPQGVHGSYGHIMRKVRKRQLPA
jgi:hypothetical protein